MLKRIYPQLVLNKRIFISSTSTVPPWWLLNRPSVDLYLSNFAKSETNPRFKSKSVILTLVVRYAQIDPKRITAAAAAMSGDVVKSLGITKSC